MALTTSASLENVKASVEQYIKENLEGTDRLTVAWEGMTFRTEDFNEWIEPYLVVPTRIFHRQTSSTTRGNTVDWLYQVDVYVKRHLPFPVNAHRLQEMRDIVLGRFTEFTKISLKDFAADGNPELRKMIVRMIVTDQRNPSADPDLRRWTVAFTLQYLEEY